MTLTVDDRYYELVKPASYAECVLMAARDRIYRDFIDLMQPNVHTSILDVGVSDVISGGANVLERSYPHRHRITACGLGEGGEFRAAFPGIKYVRIVPGGRLPFEDRSFDIVTANAVLEHVGGSENQMTFVRELCRVGKQVFISVPNRFFPIEHHTGVPLLHYSDRLFAAICRASGKSHWALRENLMLISRARLMKIADMIGRDAEVGYSGLRLGPLSSNLHLAFN